MAKPTAVWGIDIGQCALKALKFELIEGKPTATAFDYIEHPKILSQPDADPDQLTREALEKFLSRNQLGSDIIAISVPGQSGLARFVKLPPVEEKKIPDIVRFEAKQQIPFPLEEVVWDYQKISGGDVVNNFAMETEIGLFAMKREMISRYLGQFNAVNIECHVVQMAPLALCNFATYELLKKGGPDAPPADAPQPEDTPRGKKRCAVVLDIGTDGSNLIITDGGKIIWQRPIPLGGNNFTRALTKEMKLTFAKAEHLKRNAAKSPDLAQILKALRPVLQDFVGEVQRSLGYFTNTHRDAHVAYMVGLGSAFRLPGLQKYMAEKLSLDVRKPTGFERLAGEQVLNDPVFTENILTFPIAYGLALQGLNQLTDRKDFGRINTNLLPAEIRTERIIRAKKPWAAAAAAALLLGTAAMALGYGVEYRAVTDAGIKKAQEEAKAAVDRASQQISRKTAEENAIRADQDAVKAIIEGNDDRLTHVRLNEVLAVVLPRAGENGNLVGDPTMEMYWSTEEGRRALQKYRERMKAGIPLEKIAEDDLTSHLAHINIESIYTRYVEDVDAFLENADAWAKNTFGQEIARSMLDSEREEVEEGGRMRYKPKGPGGAAWVYQINGYTHHVDASRFLLQAVIKNFQKANMYAEKTAIDPTTGKEKVGKFLTGVSDPVKGNISHAFILFSRPVPNPQPNQFRFLTQYAQVIDNFITASDMGGMDSGSMYGGGTGAGSEDGLGGMPGAPMMPGMFGMGGARGGWQPLFGHSGGGVSGGMGMGGPGGAGMFGMGMGGPTPPGGGGMSAPLRGMPPSGPGALGVGGAGGGGSEDGLPGAGGPMTPPGLGTPMTPNVTPSKDQRTRTEFVICFLWKEPNGDSTAAPAETDEN
jgi:type IV pilus assembly protein PilM